MSTLWYEVIRDAWDREVYLVGGMGFWSLADLSRKFPGVILRQE